MSIYLHTSQNSAGFLELHDDGCFSTASLVGAGSWTLHDGQIHLYWRSGANEIYTQGEYGHFTHQGQKLIPSKAKYYGTYPGFDPSQQIYTPITKRNLTVGNSWADSGSFQRIYDVVLSGENCSVEITEHGFRYRHLHKTELASAFIGVPRIDHERAFHLPLFYAYWSQFRAMRPRRVKPQMGISFVASNAGYFGDLSDKRLEIAKKLTKWFPVAVNSRVAEYFAGTSATVWNVPSDFLAKYDFISHYKYNLCFENSIASGYITEKLFDPIISGVMGLYHGSDDVENWFHKDALINCCDLEAEDIADAIADAERSRKADLVWQERESLIKVSLDDMTQRLEDFCSAVFDSDTTSKSNCITFASLPPVEEIPSSLIRTDGTPLKHKYNSYAEFLASIPFQDTNFDELTVVVKTILRHESLCQCIESISRVVGRHVPIIIVDDSPQPFGGSFEPQVQYHHVPREIGLSAGRNYGLRFVKSKYVMFADDDAQLISPEPFLKAVFYYLENGFDLVGEAALYTTLRPEKDEVLVWEAPITELIERCEITDNFFIAHTSAVKNVLWDESIMIGHEHADFFFRFRKAGYKVGGTDLLAEKQTRWQMDGSYLGLRHRSFADVFKRKWGVIDYWARMPNVWNQLQFVYNPVADSCGPKIIFGKQRKTLWDWLNVGVFHGPGVVLPFDEENRYNMIPGQSASHVAIDRILEYMNLPDVIRFMQQVMRIAKDGAMIRVAVLNWDKIRTMFDKPDCPVVERFIRWYLDENQVNTLGYDPIFVINHMFQHSGYGSYFDATYLCHLLEEIGCTEIKAVNPRSSQISEFIGIDDDLNLPREIYEHFYLIVEAVKLPAQITE